MTPDREAEQRALVDQWREIHHSIGEAEQAIRAAAAIPPAIVDGRPVGALRDQADRERAEIDAEALRAREREIRAHLLDAHQRATGHRVTGDTGAGTFITKPIADAIRDDDLARHRRSTARDLAAARAGERHQRDRLTAAMDHLPALYRTRAYRARGAAAAGVAAVTLTGIAFAYGSLPALAAVLLASLTLFLIGGVSAARQDIADQIMTIHGDQATLDCREADRIEAEVAHLAAGGNPDTDTDAQDDGRPAPGRRRGRRLPRL